MAPKSLTAGLVPLDCAICPAATSDMPARAASLKNDSSGLSAANVRTGRLAIRSAIKPFMEFSSGQLRGAGRVSRTGCCQHLSHPGHQRSLLLGSGVLQCRILQMRTSHFESITFIEQLRGALNFNVAPRLHHESTLSFQHSALQQADDLVFATVLGLKHPAEIFSQLFNHSVSRYELGRA